MPDVDTFLGMTNYQFMKIYRSRYNHAPELKARLDAQPGYSPMTTAAPGSESAKIAQERTRRGLAFPDSWIAAGLRTEEEDF